MTDAETVHADPETRLYHREADAAGALSIPDSRPQARLPGFRECPDCYWGGDDAE